MRKLGGVVVAAATTVGAATAGFVPVPALASTVPPRAVTARVLPKHISRPPYNWTTTGTITPAQICFAPTAGRPSYCETAPCTGTVKVVFSKASSGVLLATDTAPVDATTCTYTVLTHIPRHLLRTTRRHWIWLAVVATYSGNSVMSSKSARTHYVRAKTIRKRHHH
jgi:hypothetical protein